MKIYSLIAFALLGILLFVMPLAIAEDVNDTAPADEQNDSVIAPPASEENATLDEETLAEINDEMNESVSGLRIGWENVKLWFTFNNEKKAMQELKIAKLKLIQARIFAKNNDTEAMQGALEAHDRILQRVQERINAIDSASDAEGVKDAAAKLVGLERAIEVHEARISKIKELIASENLTEQQRTVLENRLSKAEQNTAHLKEVESEKKEKIKTRLRAVANMTEEEADSEIEEIEDAQNLSAVKKIVSEAKARNTERIRDRERTPEAEESEEDAESENETEESE